MDAQRFDRMARLLAAGGDRRRLLRGLAAIGAGALFARDGVARGQEAPAAACVKDVDCAAGLICCADGTCCQGAAPPPTPAPTVGCQSDAECPVTSGDPCGGARCQDGVCTEFTVACAAGSTCCGNGQCCPIPCLSDVDCLVEGSDPCTQARCEAGSCVSFTIDCGSDACCGGVCLPPCETGQTYDEACRCVWVPAARPWRRFLRDRD